MAKKCANPTWGKGMPLAPAGVSSFDAKVEALKLSPKEYVSSIPLKDWVRINKKNKFVPLELLQVWGFTP
jgi:hypothetical protein